MILHASAQKARDDHVGARPQTGAFSLTQPPKRCDGSNRSLYARSSAVSAAVPVVVLVAAQLERCNLDRVLAHFKAGVSRHHFSGINCA